MYLYRPDNTGRKALIARGNRVLSLKGLIGIDSDVRGG